MRASRSSRDARSFAAVVRDGTRVLVLFLHNLNARAVGALAKELAVNLDALLADLRKLIDEADAFIREMGTEEEPRPRPAEAGPSTWRGSAPRSCIHYSFSGNRQLACTGRQCTATLRMLHPGPRRSKVKVHDAACSRSVFPPTRGT